MDEKQREAIKAMLVRRTDQHTLTDQIAENWLIEEGLLDQSGKLRPQFGGDGQEKDKD